MVSYERLPMLEIVFDRLVRLMTTSLRNFTSDNVEVSLDRITSVRFGDYLNSIPLPAILAVFKAEEWDNFGLMTVNSGLIYSIIDVLLGGRRGQTAVRVEGRPYTTIESNLVKRMIEVVLADAELAFKPLSPVKFNIDRMETNPRFAAISRPANAAILVRLRIDMEDRGGELELLLPYATIEPIREVLLQMFMGEKFGRDPIWEGHLATEIGQAEIAVDAVLYEAKLPLKRDDESRGRRHADAGAQARRHGQRALRRRHLERGPHGPGRRPRRGARRQAVAQAAHHLRHVREGRRNQHKDGGAVINVLPLTIESLVAILLLLTILYCIRLNEQLKRLKADGTSMQQTIAELITATESAERAIAGLKATVREADETLGERLKAAERYSVEMKQNATAGAEVLNRLSKIAGAHLTAQPSPRTEQAPPPDAKSIVAAAQAFAERTRARVKGLAA